MPFGKKKKADPTIQPKIAEEYSRDDGDENYEYYEGRMSGDVTLSREGEDFLTPPPEGWLHEEFALSYGEGVYYK